MDGDPTLSATALVSLPFRDGSVDVEYLWLNRDLERTGAPLVVFLHEGLGSVSAWRDFPARLCAAGGFRGLVYSRPGYGHSTPRSPGVRWRPEYLHDQAVLLLPALLSVLGVDPVAEPPWLFGHSDGGSIALIHAAAFPARVAGIAVVAPHIFIEELSVAGITAAREAYRTTDLREKLARHHADPDSAFWGWNDVWFDPAFRAWDLRPLLPRIRCPVLAVQGRDDHYGTLAQIEGIAHAVPRTTLLALDHCGHAVHRDEPERLIRAVIDFVRGRHGAATAPNS